MHVWTNQYSSWLLYESGAWDLGDDVATRIWVYAAEDGAQGIEAMDDALPLATFFPRFAVRNWHQDFKPGEYLYESRDPTFPPDLKPDPVIAPIFAGPGTAKLLLSRAAWACCRFASTDSGTGRMYWQPSCRRGGPASLPMIASTSATGSRSDGFSGSVAVRIDGFHSSDARVAGAASRGVSSDEGRTTCRWVIRRCHR